MEEAIVLKMVRDIRKDMPYLDTEKLYHLLKPSFKSHRIKMGRDALHALIYKHGMVVRRRKRKVRTTNSYHRFKKYPNLVQGMQVIAPEQLWVRDITYVSTKRCYVYLSLVTDAYSRKIVGYHLSESLHTQGCIVALKMALSCRCYLNQELIHHSDRGIQYCSNEYVELLIRSDVLISMTENGDPYENALAERVNGILKSEFGLSEEFRNFDHARERVERSVFVYNQKRPPVAVTSIPQMKHTENKAF